MNKKILAFLVALFSFMAIIPIHSDVSAALPVLPEGIPTGFAGRIGEMTAYFAAQPRVVEINGKRVLAVGRIDGNKSAFAQIYAKVCEALHNGEADSVIFLGNYLSWDDSEGNAYVLQGLINLYDRFRERVVILRGSHENDWALQREDFFPRSRRSEFEFLTRFLQSLPCAAIVNGSTFLASGTIPADEWQCDSLFRLGHMNYDGVRYDREYKNIVTQLTCGDCFLDDMNETSSWNWPPSPEIGGFWSFSSAFISSWFKKYIQGKYDNSLYCGGWDLSNLSYAVFGNNNVDANSYRLNNNGNVTLFRSGPPSSAVRAYYHQFTIIAIERGSAPRVWHTGSFQPNPPSYAESVSMPAPAPVPATAAPREDSSLFGWLFGWLWPGK